MRRMILRESVPFGIGATLVIPNRRTHETAGGSHARGYDHLVVWVDAASAALDENGVRIDCRLRRGWACLSEGEAFDGSRDAEGGEHAASGGGDRVRAAHVGHADQRV